MKRFRCMGCGDCCRGFTVEDSPVVFPWEKRRLEELAGERGLSLRFDPLMVFCRGGDCVAVLYRWVIEGDCPFLVGDRCSIHPDRPLACRMYPLIVGFTDNTLRLSARCRWVEENQWVVRRSIDPRRVFPEESSAAIKAYAVLNKMVAALRRNGYTETRPGEAGSIRDYDEVFSHK